MGARRDSKRAWVLALLGAAIVAVLMTVGCFGGDDDADSTDATSGDGVDVSVTMPEETTTVAVIDPLSSFSSKDPFIPQAQATTTVTQAPVTTVITTTSTTEAPTTTTVVHRLRVTAFPGGGAASFSIDDVTFTGITPSSGLFIGPWGTVQLVSVNDTTAPFSAAFQRANSIDFTLYLNQTKTW